MNTHDLLIKGLLQPKGLLERYVIFQKSQYLKKNADWITEILSVHKKNNNTLHQSIKITPVEASKKVNGKSVFSDLHDYRENINQKFN